MALIVPADPVWSSTISPVDLGSGLNFGCSNVVATGRCSDTSYLTDDDFIYDGVSNSITGMFLRTGDLAELTMYFSPNITRDTASALTLNVDSTQLQFSNSETTGLNGRSWSSKGLDWSDGTDVSLSLTAPRTVPGKPTHLSATADGEMQIDLSWNAPAVYGGSDISG